MLGRPEPWELFVTCRVIDPFELECGTVIGLALDDGSSNEVDLMPFDDVDVVTFAVVDVPLDLMSLCLVELFGELWLCATVVAEPCDESKLE